MALAASLAAGSVEAGDTPAFDRPGIAFGTTTLPVGSGSWEQGLPDFSRDSRDGMRTTQYTADTLLRFGVAGSVELQLAVDSYNRQTVSGGGRRDTNHGGGDAGVGMKVALPTSSHTFSWALLGSATLPTGQAPFGGEGHRYALAATTSWDLGEERGIALYAGYQRAKEGRGWTFSPSYSFAVSDNVGAYLEAGFASGDDDSRVAGGGLTWQVAPRVQLDGWVLRALTPESPDWQGGFGVSLYFP